MIMITSCLYFILLTRLSLNIWAWLSILTFAWGQARSKLGGVDMSILHHVFMLIFIALWTVISHYSAILMPFLSYFTRFTWRGRMPAAGILDWKGANLRYLFYTTPNFLKLFGETIEGNPPGGHKPGARPTLQGMPPEHVGPLASPRCPSSAIWRALT